jgi:hypothetical protein
MTPSRPATTKKAKWKITIATKGHVLATSQFENCTWARTLIELVPAIPVPRSAVATISNVTAFADVHTTIVNATALKRINNKLDMFMFVCSHEIEVVQNLKSGKYYTLQQLNNSFQKWAMENGFIMGNTLIRDSYLSVPDVYPYLAKYAFYVAPNAVSDHFILTV